jgi:hypothetical protein
MDAPHFGGLLAGIRRRDGAQSRDDEPLDERTVAHRIGSGLGLLVVFVVAFVGGLFILGLFWSHA